MIKFVYLQQKNEFLDTLTIFVGCMNLVNFKPLFESPHAAGGKSRPILQK